MQKVQNLSQPWMIGMKVATEGVLGMSGAEASRHVPSWASTRRMMGPNSWGRMKQSA